MKLRKDSLFIVIAISFLFSCDKIPDPRLFIENKKAVKLLETQNFVESRDHFIQALQFDPFRSELHTNLGIAFQVSQDADKALLSFKKAEELAADESLKFVNRYNQGVLLAAQSKVDEALAAYQRALELQPNSKEVKTNIELLIQNQQQQQKQGEGQSKDNKDDKDNKDKKNDPKDGKDKDDKNKDKNKDQQPKSVQQNQKYKPREFKGELQQNDVNKILGEIKAQEQKIRAQYNKNETKDKSREKDW